jgi:hypothetical protein
MNFQKQTHSKLSNMAPPKVRETSKMLRRTQRNNRSLEEPTMERKNPMKTEGVVDVDGIPSPVIEPVSPIVVEE